jgi:hypothetical protein
MLTSHTVQSQSHLPCGLAFEPVASRLEIDQYDALAAANAEAQI